MCNLLLLLLLHITITPMYVGECTQYFDSAKHLVNSKIKHIRNVPLKFIESQKMVVDKLINKTPLLENLAPNVT